MKLELVDSPPDAADTYLTDVFLQCVECHTGIKGRINTPYWLRVEWIGPGGECKGCYDRIKEQKANG